jgi:hypothetical protein
LSFGWHNKRLLFDRDEEKRQFVVSGDQGTGKSQFVTQILDYVERCGDVAVVLDAKLEFTPRFFNPRRGDRILSAKDDRCPFWHIGEEVTDYFDALTVTKAMYPPIEKHLEIFDSWASEIGAYLLTDGRPKGSPPLTCERFAKLLRDEEQVRTLLKGSGMENYIHSKAGPQTGATMGTLAKAGTSLSMMPRETEGRPKFTIRHWCATRNGWLFLPNPADFREALRPLLSLWADMLAQRLMSMGARPNLPRVWLVLDELDTLHRLPQLQAAITEMRSTGNPIVLSFQNFGQLVTRYGEASAHTIISQPLSKFLLRTSDGDSAKSLEKMIGDVELRRYRENRSGSLLGRGDRNSFSGPEDSQKPLIMASEIQALPDMEGYFVQCGQVVKIKLPYIERREKAPAWIDRPIPPEVRAEQQAATPEPVLAPPVYVRTAPADLSALL